jgi:hypothetical protein
MFKQIEKIVELAKRDVEFSENYRFNHHETIKRINLYLNNRFLERADGIFWNISNYRVQHFAKNIELDTKDLMPYGDGEVAAYQAFILRIKLKRWAEERKLALTLNDLAETAAAYGSAVWKVVGNDVELVDLSNLYFDPLTRSIRDVDVIEKHYLSANELRDKKDTWKNVDELLSLKPESDGRYEINEFFGWYCENENEYNEETDGWKRVISYGKGEAELILDEQEATKEDNPYYDFHLTKYEGRWMRIGVVERLFALQERVNQLVNQNAQSTEIASLLLFRTAQGDVVGNVLEEAVNGQIISSQDLEQIGISNTGLNQFVNELQLIENQADKLCLTPDVITGEALPSGTPFRSMATLTNAARTAFKMIRENVGERIAYVMKEIILPDVVRGWNRESILEITQDDGDISIYDEAIKKKIKHDIILSGKVYDPSMDEALNMIVDKKLAEQGRKVALPKGFFNFKFNVKFNVTGEAFDKAQMNSAYENAIMMTAQNPALLNIPLFRQYLENNGISYWKLKPEEIQQIVQGQQQMGGQVQTQGMEPKQDKLMSAVDSN